MMVVDAKTGMQTINGICGNNARRTLNAGPKNINGVNKCTVGIAVNR